MRCADPELSARMVAEVDDARKAGDTLGGVVEVIAYGLPAGVGSRVRNRSITRILDAVAGTPLVANSCRASSCGSNSTRRMATRPGTVPRRR